jgi:hypothetical protein
VELAIVALVLGPSLVVFLAGCLLALTRTWRLEHPRQARSKQRGRPA